jgi:NAD(P)-dependent dehydrogenase (short-subunit alcohol dehydrogenase family)
MLSIITGTSQGLGKELAEELKESYDIIVINRTATNIPNEIICDLSDKTSVENALDILITKLTSEKEILFVLNAGDYGEDKTVNDIDPTVLGKLVYTNVFSQLAIVEKLLTNGIKVRLIAISSPMGSVSLAPESYHYAYSLSKAGLNLSIRLLHREFKNLDYFIVDPGWIKTRMGGDSAPEDPLQVAKNTVTAMKDSTNWNRSDGMVGVNSQDIVRW